MSMSEAHARCEELGIPTDAPDALPRLWAAVLPRERVYLFPHADRHDVDVMPGWVPVPKGADVPERYWALTDPMPGEIRMWNGTSGLVFRVGARRAQGEYKIRYTNGGEAYSSWRELRESSHVTVTAQEVADRVKLLRATPAERAVHQPAHQHEAWQVAPAADGGAYCAACGASLADGGKPVRGRLSFPPADGAARARELAAEHIRRARARLDCDVPKGGRPWRPGDTPRGAVLREAADVLARLCAVYLGADAAHESPRNHDEARAYALAFRLVETSARRLSMRRYR